MFMLLRINDWNNNLREIQCPTCTHITLYCKCCICCNCVSVGAAEHPFTRLGPAARGRCGKQRKSGSLCQTGHLEMSDGDLCQHTVLLCSWQPKGRVGWEQSRISQTDLTEQCHGCRDPRPDVLWQRGSGWAAPHSQGKCQTGISNSIHKWKVQFGKAKGTGWIQHGTEEAVVQWQTVWELAQFVIHSVRCYPKQKNKKSAWRAMFWFRAVQVWGTFSLIFQNS